MSNKLDQSMDNFASHMHKGVKTTFTEFDVTLKQAVQYLARGVNNIKEVVDSMELDIEKVDHQMTKFNDILEQFTQTDNNKDE